MSQSAWKRDLYVDFFVTVVKNTLFVLWEFFFKILNAPSWINAPLIKIWIGAPLEVIWENKRPGVYLRRYGIWRSIIWCPTWTWLITFFFRLDYGLTNTDRLYEYISARMYGEHTGNCESAYPQCPFSAFNLLNPEEIMHMLGNQMP